MRHTSVAPHRLQHPVGLRLPGLGVHAGDGSLVAAGVEDLLGLLRAVLLLHVAHDLAAFLGERHGHSSLIFAYISWFCDFGMASRRDFCTFGTRFRFLLLAILGVARRWACFVLPLTLRTFCLVFMATPPCPRPSHRWLRC